MTACYLYCLTPSRSATATATTGIGVDGQSPASLCGYEGVGAVLNEVELNEFCGESAAARLQDLEWLGPRAVRHEAVIEEVMRAMPVLPARFATLFDSAESLRQFIHEHRDPIAQFFAMLGDKQEWGVKGLLHRSVAAPALADANPGPVSPGARYLDSKRIQAQLERDFQARLKEFCRQAAAALGLLAADFRERKVLAPATAADGAEILLNWAFLVSPAVIGDFRARLDRLNGGEAFPGLSFALTGPWPPYNFAPNLE